MGVAWCVSQGKSHTPLSSIKKSDVTDYTKQAVPQLGVVKKCIFVAFCVILTTLGYRQYASKY